MLKYAVLVQYSDADRCYVARVPQLKGCVAHGDTPAEALEEILVAQELWIESAMIVGHEIPEPTPITV